MPVRDSALAGLLLGLQCAGRAAAVMDEAGKIVWMNPLAQPFVAPFGRGDLARPAESRIFDLIEAALRPGRGPEGVAAMLDLPGQGRLVVRATDLRVAAPRLFREARVLLQFASLGLDALPAGGFLRAALGLTATEAEVALALARGATASSIARDRAISLETVRSHLKTIFAKTGTRRQATLVAMVLQLRGVSSPG